MPTLAERFETKFMPEPMSGCWLWTEGLFYHGYGAIKVSGKMLKAHRLSWILYRGPVPDNLLVLHKCDVKCCVNPDHLYIGTYKNNTRDLINRGNSSFFQAPSEELKRKRAARLPRGDNHWRRRGIANAS